MWTGLNRGGLRRVHWQKNSKVWIWDLGTGRLRASQGKCISRAPFNSNASLLHIRTQKTFRQDLKEEGMSPLINCCYGAHEQDKCTPTSSSRAAYWPALWTVWCTFFLKYNTHCIHWFFCLLVCFFPFLFFFFLFFFVSPNSWGKCLALYQLICLPAITFACLSYILELFSTENNCKTVKTVRVNQNSKVIGLKPKTLSWKMLQSSVKLKGAAGLGDNSQWYRLNEWRRSGKRKVLRIAALKKRSWKRTLSVEAKVQLGFGRPSLWTLSCWTANRITRPFSV